MNRHQQSVTEKYSKLLHLPNTKRSMSELGKIKEGRDCDVNLYLMSCKAETGLDSDRLPHECMLAEIKNSVIETGRGHSTS